jgi:hypothetical protein
MYARVVEGNDYSTINLNKLNRFGFSEWMIYPLVNTEKAKVPSSMCRKLQ